MMKRFAQSSENRNFWGFAPITYSMKSLAGTCDLACWLMLGVMVIGFRCVLLATALGICDILLEVCDNIGFYRQNGLGRLLELAKEVIFPRAKPGSVDLSNSVG